MAGLGPAVVEGEDPERVAVIVGLVVVKLDAGPPLEVGFGAGQQAADDVLQEDHLVVFLAAAPGPAVADQGGLSGVGKADDVGVGGTLSDELTKVVGVCSLGGRGLADPLGVSGQGLGKLGNGGRIAGLGHNWFGWE